MKIILETERLLLREIELSDAPFAFELKEGTLIIYSDYEKVEAIASGNTLRDAYVAAKDKHFPASGKTPNALMFKSPQYNTWIELGSNQNQKDLLKKEFGKMAMMINFLML